MHTIENAKSIIQDMPRAKKDLSPLLDAVTRMFSHAPRYCEVHIDLCVQNRSSKSSPVSAWYSTVFSPSWATSSTASVLVAFSMASSTLWVLTNYSEGSSTHHFGITHMKLILTSTCHVHCSIGLGSLGNSLGGNKDGKKDKKQAQGQKK